tara:strand:- start:50128 stop:50817 length:690 start_codon:yes stop_codon:yes gene_type:complete
MRNLIDYQINEIKNQHNECFNKYLESENNHKYYVLKRIYDTISSIIEKIERNDTDFNLEDDLKEETIKDSNTDSILFPVDFYKEKYWIKYYIVDFLLTESHPFYSEKIKEKYKNTSNFTLVNNKLKIAAQKNSRGTDFKEGVLELLFNLIDLNKLKVSKSFNYHLDINSNILFFIKSDDELHMFIKNIILIVLLENMELIIKKEEEEYFKYNRMVFEKVDIENYKKNIY